MSLASKLAQIPNITTNYIPRATATGFANGVIYDNGTNVGIGTSSPVGLSVATNLIVRGTASLLNGYVQALSNDGASSIALYSGGSSIDNPSIIFQNNLRFGTATDSGTTGYTERMRLSSGGCLVINSTSTQSEYSTGVYKLITRIGTNRNIAFGIQGGDSSIESFNDAVNAGAPLRIYADNLQILTSGLERMRILSGGNVGIGNTNPAYKLSVTGTVNATELVLNGTSSFNYTPDGNWTSYQTIVPTGTMSTGAVYLVRLAYNSGNASPYVCYASFIWTCMGSNGGGADNAFSPMMSTHQGTTAYFNVRNLAVSGQGASGIQVQFVNFASISAASFNVLLTRLQ